MCLYCDICRKSLVVNAAQESEVRVSGLIRE